MEKEKKKEINKEEKEAIQMPLSLRIKKASEKIINLILVTAEDCQLDWFHLKQIVDNIANQISINAQKQIENEEEIYEQQLLKEKGKGA